QVTSTMAGPKVDGIDHDYDVFELLLNPVVTVEKYPQNVVLWNMGIKKEDKGIPKTISVLALWLKDPAKMPVSVKQVLDERGLTTSDYAQILSTNPFAKGSATIDLDRFHPTAQTFPYSPGTETSTPGQKTLILSTDQTHSSINEVATEYSVSMTVAIGIFTDKSKLTWTSKNSAGKSATSKQSASATVGGPGVGSNCPPIVYAYWDTLYSSFMFSFTQPPSQKGTLHDESGQPVAHEQVTLTVGGHQFSTLTDAQGEYRFLGTPEGKGTIA